MKKLILVLILSMSTMFVQSQTLDPNNRQDRTTISVDSVYAILGRVFSAVEGLGVIRPPASDSIKAAINRTTSNTTNSFNYQFAQKGLEIITDGSAHTGTFYGLFTIDSCRIASVTYQTGYTPTGNTIVGKLLYAGTWLPIHFTSITLTRGIAILPKE